MVRERRREVFIASRFAELDPLRKELARLISQHARLAPIDLNDESAGPKPPLSECLARVREADIMVLLLDESYGSPAPGHEKSFTHLEYEAAIREERPVLVYAVEREAPSSRRQPQLEAWMRTLVLKHKVGNLQRKDRPAAQAAQVLTRVLDQLYDLDLHSRSEGEDEDSGDALPRDLSDDSLDLAADGFDDDEITALDAKEALKRGRSTDSARIGESRDADSPARFPAATAALEQRVEALHALQLRESRIAVQHLAKALKLRPLDVLANFWLAKVYLATGRSDRLTKAAQLARRAARGAESEQAVYRAAACHLLAARASSRMDLFGDAHNDVDEAALQAPNFAKVYLERARLLCRENKTNAAIEQVRWAFKKHEASLAQALRDPHLRSIRPGLRELQREMIASWTHDVRKILSVEGQIAELLGKTPALEEPRAGVSLRGLAALARNSLLRQRGMVMEAMQAGERAFHDSRLDDPSRTRSTAQEASAAITRLEGAFARAQEAEALARRETAITSWLPSLLHEQVACYALVALPVCLVAAWLLPALIAASAGLAALSFGACLLYMKLAYDAANARHAVAQQGSLHAQETLDAARNELARWHTHWEREMALARDALSMFEKPLGQVATRYQPFARLRVARPGQLIYLSPSSLAQLEENDGRRIEYTDASWADAAHSQEFGLYRAVSVTRGLMRVARASAYDAHESDPQLVPVGSASGAPPASAERSAAHGAVLTQ